MIKIKDIINSLEQFAPLALQENYDNCGLITGNREDYCSKALLTIDATEEIVDEAIALGANLIISHHPVVFSGLKSITGKNYVERTIIKAIKNDVAIYAAHTNFDSVLSGVNSKIAEKLRLESCRILVPRSDMLKKLVTFIPVKFVDKVSQALFEAGAGKLGNYDSCAFTLSGKGSFKASDKANPYVGEKGKIHFEDEIRFETIFPKYQQGKIISALMSSHPYEEVAYDIYSLDNELSQVGMGCIGELNVEMDEKLFLNNIKQLFKVPVIRHSPFLNKSIKKVAICGGSGSFLLADAIKNGANILISGDFKYHQFFDAEKRILIADIGHFESEQYTKELFYDILTKKFPNFAFHFSEINTNPISYF
jgi:dinuclear metal center YbgI/SA1388 family protein